MYGSNRPPSYLYVVAATAAAFEGLPLGQPRTVPLSVHACVCVLSIIGVPS